MQNAAAGQTLMEGLDYLERRCLAQILLDFGKTCIAFLCRIVTDKIRQFTIILQNQPKIICTSMSP